MTNSRIPALDGLRGLAAMVVVTFHCTVPGFGGGYLGVDVFFVLSGYVITRLLLTELDETGRIDRGRFYYRRFLRLVPAYSAMLAVYLIAAPYVWPGEPHGRDVLVSALYLSDYGVAIWRVPHYLSGTWTLAVEEHFYLLWPLLLPILAKRPRWLIVAYVAMTLWRFDLPLYRGHFAPDSHSTGLLLGALAAQRRWTLSAASAWAGAALLVALTVFPHNLDPVNTRWLVTAAELATLALILGVEKAGPLNALLSSRPLLALGALSYAIYLWHYPFVAWSVRRMDPLHCWLFSVSLTVMFATLSYYFIERPARSWRNADVGAWLRKPMLARRA